MGLLLLPNDVQVWQPQGNVLHSNAAVRCSTQRHRRYAVWPELFPCWCGRVAVPCMVTDAGDSSPFVGDTGIVALPRERSTVAEVHHRIMGASDVWRSMSIGARERIIKHLSMETFVQMYCDLDNSLGNGIC